ncbi:hypothetical protein KDI_41040 [Dictyobacter arantiisoli]|uniref:Uncharacterized protein n=1 Tax=Dictyobacter arantiisoli TaxID=2014874 RepID=A0A5A5TG36_9CHLR|nr:hypothetical protein KDI_41040 [Dictyobacter arantiisoli]
MTCFFVVVSLMCSISRTTIGDEVSIPSFITFVNMIKEFHFKKYDKRIHFKI